MAKRKERALAQKGPASKRGKAGKKVKSSPRKSAKRTKKTAQRVAAKTKAKKLGTNPRARQAALKKVGPRPTEPSTKADEGTEETIIVDIVERAVPGLVVVTEFESVRTNGPEAPSPQPEGE